MEIRDLHYFKEVATSGNISKTADKIHITQPALSKIITRLEDELGVRLFNRTGKNITLNSYGESALKYVNTILASVDDMTNCLQDMKSGRAAIIRLSTTFPTDEYNWLIDCIHDFLLENDEVKLHCSIHTPHQQKQALENREIDIAISNAPIISPKIEWTELGRERWGVILSRQHRLAKVENLHIIDFKDEHFWCINATTDIKDMTQIICERAGFNPIKSFEGQLPDQIGEAVSLGKGVSLISEKAFAQQSIRRSHADKVWDKNIIFRPLMDDFCVRINGIAMLKGRYITKVNMYLREKFIQYYSQTKII